MLKSSLGTAALVAGWSALWFVNVLYLGQGGGMTNACLRDPTKCTSGGEDGPLDIAIWVIGLVAIVALRVWLYRRRLR
jgi:hypothetical protein